MHVRTQFPAGNHIAQDHDAVFIGNQQIRAPDVGLHLSITIDIDHKLPFIHVPDIDIRRVDPDAEGMLIQLKIKT